MKHNFSKSNTATGKTAMRIKYFSGEDVKHLIENTDDFKVVVSDDTVIASGDKTFVNATPDPDNETGKLYKINFWYDIDESLINDQKYDEIARIIRKGIYKRDNLNVGLYHILTTDRLKSMLEGELDHNHIIAHTSFDDGKTTIANAIGYIYMDEAGMFVFKDDKSNYEYELGDFWTIPTDMDNPDDFLKDMVKRINTALCEVLCLSHPIMLNRDEICDLYNYIYRAWHCLRYNFEKTDMYGDTWYSCNEDEYGDELPIWQWYIGNKDRDKKVEIGFLRINLAELFESGNLIKEMVEVLDDIIL